MRYLAASMLLSGLLVGCADSPGAPSADNEAAAADPVNAYCPIMGGKVVLDGGSTKWKGKTVGFCCPECEPKWEALSHEGMAQKLAAAEAQVEAHAHEHEKDEHAAEHASAHDHS